MNNKVMELIAAICILCALAIFAGGCERAHVPMAYDNRILYNKLNVLTSKVVTLDNKLDIVGKNVLDLEYHIRWQLPEITVIDGYGLALED